MVMMKRNGLLKVILKMIIAMIATFKIQMQILKLLVMNKGDVGSDQFDETESITDSALRQSLERLISDDAKEWVYLDLPKFKYQDFMVECSEIQSDLNEWFYRDRSKFTEESSYYNHECVEYAARQLQCIQKRCSEKCKLLGQAV